MDQKLHNRALVVFIGPDSGAEHNGWLLDNINNGEGPGCSPVCPAWMFVPAAAIRGVLADLARHVPLRSRSRADVRKRRPAKRVKVTDGAKALAAFREVIARKEQARRAKLMVAVTVMRSATATDDARVRAASVVLDRAYGKPPQSQDIHLIGDLHIESMSDRQLAALVARALSRQR
ncbi:MAG TPA: hypothetical protein VKA12_04410, partial [Roseiarcus sp.]|nr:hypothetical protein [Roseiarcus sp.]